MHRIHHSSRPEEMRTNFGFCLSVWDKLFHSWLEKPIENPQTMRLGLELFRSDRAQRVDQLLIQPLDKGDAL